MLWSVCVCTRSVDVVVLCYSFLRQKDQLSVDEWLESAKGREGRQYDATVTEQQVDGEGRCRMK